MALVLGEHHDLEVARVREIGERKVDDAVRATERNRGFRSVICERQEPVALSAGKHDDEDTWIGGHGPTVAITALSVYPKVVARSVMSQDLHRPRRVVWLAQPTTSPPACLGVELPVDG